MHLNRFSEGLDAVNLAIGPEFDSLKASAADLSITYPPQVRYVSANTVLRHLRFHYLQWGDAAAEPILLLHGGNQSAHSWDLVSLNLCDQWSVFALDQRGHGDSEWSRGAHYDIPELMADAAAFIRAVIGRPCIVVGHSMGGLAACALALNHPELVERLVMVDIGPEVNEEGRRMIREFVGRNIEFDDMNEFLDRVARYDPYRSRAHIERTLKYNLIRRADGKYVPKADRRRYHRADSHPAIPGLAAVQAISCRALVVRGGTSTVLDREAAERFARTLPRGQFVEIPDCGHNVAQQNTLAFLHALRGFLGGV
ncbi:MAG: alpha/beta hydrolase [Pseudomonadales bacterium]|nr:alpha/beta hydrolase [Pseudomonadales bacterium]MCP5183241.1 alpha/beta hydrolase [Pseudomonadales bacterium]